MLGTAPEGTSRKEPFLIRSVCLDNYFDIDQLSPRRLPFNTARQYLEDLHSLSSRLDNLRVGAARLSEVFLLRIFVARRGCCSSVHASLDGPVWWRLWPTSHWKRWSGGLHVSRTGVLSL